MTSYATDPGASSMTPPDPSGFGPDVSGPDREAGLWTVDVLNASISMRGLSDAEMHELDRCWQRCNPRRGGESETVATRQGELSWRQQQEDIVSMLTLAGINSAAGERLMFHAGGISDPETGRSLALVAKSGTGKTTAVRNLAQHFGYLSDETIAIDPGSLRILPYPKPLSVLGQDGNRPKRQYSPDELGLLPAASHPVLGKIAVLNRVPGTAEALAEPLDTTAALRLLVPDSSSLSRLERGLVALLEVLERTGGAVRISYGENTQLTPLVPELLRQGPIANPDGRDWTPADLTVDGPQRPGPGAGRLRRIVPDDAIWLGDSAAILNAERLDVISGIGATIWAAARTWTDQEQLHEAVVAAHGPHPDSAALAADAVASLLEARLLVRCA